MINSTTDFLSKLVVNSPQLFILVLGTFTLVLSGASELPLGNGIPMASLTRVLCGVVGLGLILYALWALYGNEKVRITDKTREFQKQLNLKEETLREHEQKIEAQAREIEKLNQLISEAKQVASGKSYREIQSILSGIQETLKQDGDREQFFKRAAEWVRVKVDSHAWVNLVTPSDFSDYGINRGNIQAFRDEISLHLRALQENLEDAFPNRLPKRLGVTQEVASSSLAYQQALLTVILPKMEEDLRQAANLLDEEQREQIKAYMKILIEKTDV